MNPTANWTEEQKRAVAAVRATMPGFKPNTGTAFYIGAGFALSALHVVADPRAREPVFADSITLSFRYAKHETTASVVDRMWDRDADWVLLKCTDPPPVPALILGAPPDKGSSVDAFGFPEIQPDGFSLPAVVQDPSFRRAGVQVIDIYSEKGKAVPLYGLSGAPCFQEGKVVGILRAVLEPEVLDGRLQPKLVTDAGTVYVCPAACIVEWQEIRGNALLSGSWGPPSEITTTKFIIYLSASERQGKLTGVVNAAQKHLAALGLGAPYFEFAENVVASEAELMRNVAALCRAKVVIFDATEFEPAIMLLAGIRSVVRRGVTIFSVGGEYALGGRMSVPFNVADANIVAHSEKQDEQTPNSVDLLVERLRRGASDTASPYYQDTPVYDALRRIPAARRGLIASEEGVLVLCPFDPAYTTSNWKHLRLAFSNELKLFRDLRTATTHELGVARSFELQSPRLVSQAIYETIRRAKACVVDLTNWSPNVLFELGVRVAASGWPTACIIEKCYREWFDSADKPAEKAGPTSG